MNTASYGSVWDAPATNMNSLLSLGDAPGKTLEQILKLGYFSQFTSYPSALFNKRLVDWLEQFLLNQYGIQLSNLPSDLVELDIVPAASVVCKFGRMFSPDLLRYVSYVMLLRQVLPQAGDEITDILEIGSGYGGLARTLKCFYPRTRIWLTDIPESLRCAEIYLSKAFPEARIVWLDSTVTSTVPVADFYLVPVDEAPRLLAGKKFGLGINVWSFGEMSNGYVESWLRLLQQDCLVDWLFTINSFMAPVTPTSKARVEVGDWLFTLDERWAIEYFEIDPFIHRCPLIRNFPKGIGLIARRLFDNTEITHQRESAAQVKKRVLVEDWVGIATSGSEEDKPDHTEIINTQTESDFDEKAISSQKLCAHTDYIGHFNIEAGKDGAFFRLWNDYRMSRSEFSGALLVAFLSMIGKSDLNRRCTKEELLLLKRLAELPLHKEYAVFDISINTGEISYNGEWLTDQKACDLAVKYKQAGKFDMAEDLWTKVAAAYPLHGDCWFQLALLSVQRGDVHWAAVFAAHSVYLGCDYYAEDADQMKTSFLDGLQVNVIKGESVRDFCRQYFEVDAGKAMAMLAQWQRTCGKLVVEQALENAKEAYRSSIESRG
jgi:hypothetical protein